MRRFTHGIRNGTNSIIALEGKSVVYHSRVDFQKLNKYFNDAVLKLFICLRPVHGWTHWLYSKYAGFFYILKYVSNIA